VIGDYEAGIPFDVTSSGVLMPPMSSSTNARTDIAALPGPIDAFARPGSVRR
jgi:hypothetical protein